MNQNGSLQDPKVRETLDGLHEAARGDRLRFPLLLPKLLAGRVLGKPFQETITPSAMKDFYIPVSREQGEFLYLTCRAIGAKRVVEFGTSFAISTIYLAAAVRDNDGEVVIGTEIEPAKHERAVANLKKAGLDRYADIRLGDALETLKQTPDSLDLVLLDGWKDLYLPVLELLKPKLRRGAVVLGDNIFTFKKALRPYVEYMQSGRNGFQSMTLSMSDGFEYSCYTG